MTELRHGRVSLALHRLSEGDGRTLLLLHALYESSRSWGDLPRSWRGTVYGLDFSGHGESARIRGGAYLAETLLGDADLALAHVGPAAVVGKGVGAYVALLLAGTRPEQLPAALLLPGAGLHGGGDWPDYSAPFAATVDAAIASPDGRSDPFLRALESDVRPTDYAARFAAAARKLLMAQLGDDGPSWWKVAQQTPGAEVVDSTPTVALAALAAALAK